MTTKDTGRADYHRLQAALLAERTAKKPEQAPTAPTEAVQPRKRRKVARNTTPPQTEAPDAA